MSMWQTMPRLYDRVCLDHADRIAVIESGRHLTYRQLGQWGNRVALGLRSLGLITGDRVGVLMPNCLEFIPTQYGVWKAGGAVVQMPTRASAEDQRFFLAEANASTLIYHEQFDDVVAAVMPQLPNLRRLIRLGDQAPADGVADFRTLFESQPDTEPAVPISEDDLAYVGFTSGTTGIPKGLLHTHQTWTHVSLTAGLEIADTRPAEVFAHIAPLTHFTQGFVLPTLARGGTNVVLARADVGDLLATIARERVTAIALVPTILYLLLDHPQRRDYDLSSLRTVVYCGSPIAPERLRQAVEVFGPIFVQSYAGSEPGFITCMRKEEHRLDTADWAQRLGSAGRPMLHVDVSIQDDDDHVLAVGEVGEICARQDGQMIGYVDSARNPEAIRDGWIHSGDIGYLDAAGYLHIVDRKKDMIVTGGFNVFPRQVEDVLMQHPGVMQCAVIGIPHDTWGEAVTAFVVARPDATPTEQELIGLVKSRKGSVWAPKTVTFMEQLPLNPNGKVDKKSLRAPYWADRQRQVG